MDDFVLDLSDFGAIELDAMDVDGTTAPEPDVLGDVTAGLPPAADDSIIEMGDAPKDHETIVLDPENDESVADAPSDTAQVEKKLATGSAEDSEDEEGLEESEYPIDRPTEATQPRLFPIEVVLSPPEDPDSYEILPPSWTVEKVTREVEQDGEVWYEVEFDDGRVDMVSELLVPKQNQHGVAACLQQSRLRTSVIYFTLQTPLKDALDLPYLQYFKSPHP